MRRPTSISASAVATTSPCGTSAAPCTASSASTRRSRRPSASAFTWTWENDPSVMRGSEGSLVDVVLREAPDGTQLWLTHSGLGNKVVKDMHEEGWNALLTSLFAVLS